MSDETPLYGLDKELKERENLKRDLNNEERVRAYLSELSGEQVDQDLLESLKSGVTLCKAINTVAPGAVKKINESKMPFKQMENISFFLKACREVLKMPEYELFTTADLFDGKSVVNVTNSIISFSRAATKYGYTGTSLAPKEAVGGAVKHWDVNAASSDVSKLSLGSSQTMAATKAQKLGPTFGADHSEKMWGSTEVSKMNEGSRHTMDKTNQAANNITFGADPNAGMKSGNSDVSKLNEGSRHTMQKASNPANQITFGADHTGIQSGNSNVSKINEGSRHTMEKTTNVTNNITFGADVSK